MKALCDSSALIALDYLSSLGLLKLLFAEVAVTPAVMAEVSGGLTIPDWVKVQNPPHSAAQVLRQGLGAGESEIIALALESSPQVVVLDDKAARRVATSLGLPVVGTVGVLILARERGLIPAVRPLLNQLLNGSFRISSRLYETALRKVGELS